MPRISSDDLREHARGVAVYYWYINQVPGTETVVQLALSICLSAHLASFWLLL